MTPLYDRVLIKRDPLPEKKVGLIYLPDENSITKVSPMGNVVAVGEKCKYVKKGDRVMFHQFSTIDYDKEKNLVLIKEDDILGVEE